MKKIFIFVTDLLLNKNYGPKFLLINILFTVVPIITSIIHHSNTWTVSITIFLIYILSYKLASISESQYKTLEQQLDPNVVLKAFSFTFSILTIVIYSVIGLFKSIPIEIIYIYSYGIVSFIVLLWLILKENTEDIIGFKNKFKRFKQEYKEMVFGDKSKSIRGILKGVIISFFIFIFIVLIILINAYRILSFIDKLGLY